jgi:putative transcriptional regulator
MSHDLSSYSYLSGQLLLAVPSLRDTYFSRSVVFLAAHTEAEGAFGYILNRPIKQRVGDLMPDQELGPLGELPVYMGGPVGADKLAFASLRWSRAKQRLIISTHLSVQDALHELSMGRQVRGFVGYSGWEEGQLEREMERRSWITTEPDKRLILRTEAENLWPELLRSMGPTFGLLANIPEDISLN